MQEILDAIVAAGGRPNIVGGFVRDEIAGMESKDIDVEVFGLPQETLLDVISKFGQIIENHVGESQFCVFKLKTEDDDYDFSLPRKDVKVDDSHTGFECEFDENMSVAEASLRRDFTINAISKDYEGNYIDPYNGVQDLKDGRLVATSHKFEEDALRPLRGFQFAGRFNLTVDSDTAVRCERMLPRASNLSTERIYEEIVKWATKSVKPSMGLNFLVDTGWIKLFPELDAIYGLEQEPEYHPEGCCGTHTGLVCDAAVEIAVRDELNKEDRLVLVLAALCHDLGKATTTIVEDGKIKSPGHAHEGAEPTRTLLARMGFSGNGNLRKIVDQVVALVECHMDHIGVEPNKRFVRRLACRTHPASLQQLVRLMEADHSGRHPLPKHCPDSAVKILEISKELDIQSDKPKPIVMGRHLIDDLGMKPGPMFKVVLDECYQNQLDGVFDDLESGLKLAQKVETSAV